jgi:hypothetical protein
MSPIWLEARTGQKKKNAGVGVSRHGGMEGKLNESIVASSFEQADVRCNRHLVIDTIGVWLCARLVTSKIE